MSESTGPADFGRVEEDGTVYVKSSDGERRVGQVPDVETSEAMAFFVRRYESLAAEVTLLEQRVTSESLSIEDARRSISILRKSILSANAVGDLASLAERLDALKPVLALRAEARKAERAAQNEKTKALKEALVVETEQLAASSDWRSGVNRFRTILDEWKALPRIDRATDDELWHRFSSARTTYTRRRKAIFAAQAEKQELAKATKQNIVKRAQKLATSVDWGQTAADFRDLMTEWKAAGSAQREVDDALWSEFRAAQDQFFDARSSVLNEQHTEFKANQAAKEALLDKAEATLLPVSDLKTTRPAFREFLNSYNSIGKVPREVIRALDDRVHKIELAFKEAEETEWRRTDPEARQRASDTVNMFEAQIAKLNKQLAAAQAKGDKKKAAELTSSIATYTSWLESASKTLDEFSS